LPGRQNQLQLARVSHVIGPVLWPGRPGLVAGEMAYICEVVFYVLHHGTLVRLGQVFASSACRRMFVSANLSANLLGD
jgi:hypothetical protein